jgi:hypothetical protein
VFALLVPSCCDKSETSCYHFVTRLMMVTDLLQVFPTMFQTCQQLGTSAANTSCWQVGRFLSVRATFWHTFWHMPFTLQTALYVINFSSFTSELVVNTTDMLPLSKPHSCAFLDMNGDYTAGIYTIFITKIILTVHVP